MCEQIRWGWGWKTLCFKIGYSELRSREPRGAFHPTRKLSADEMVNSDWLLT